MFFDRTPIWSQPFVKLTDISPLVMRVNRESKMRHHVLLNLKCVIMYY